MDRGIDTRTIGDQALYFPADDGLTVKNLAGGTVYYGSSTVSAASNDGSLSVGSSVSLTSGRYFIAPSSDATIQLDYVLPAEAGSDLRAADDETITGNWTFSGTATTTPTGTTDPRAAAYGATANGSTDDITAVQAAAQAAITAGNWLDGGGKTYVISQPLLLGPSAYIRRLNLKAHATYAPVGTNTAMVQQYQGNVRTFTALASNDTFTTTNGNHGLPGDGVAVVFKGASLPTGITAGRTYYAYNRASTTFTVSATRGGATVNLTADGSGTVYCEVQSLHKMIVDDCYINGNNVTGINGAALVLQQPSQLHKLRIDNCPGFGLQLSGQQATFHNFESINCSTALNLDGAQFMYFWGFNAESCLKAVYTVPNADTIFVIGGTTSSSCLFDGVHLEMTAGSGYSTAGSICFDIVGPCQNFAFSNIHATLNTSGQKFLYAHTGSSVDSGYVVTNARIYGATTGIKAIHDTDRSHDLDAWDDFRGLITEVRATAKPSSFLYTDPGPRTVALPGAGYIKSGATIDSVPKQAFRPGSSQTGAQTVWRNASGTDKFWIDVKGQPVNAITTIPADGDLAAGQVVYWLDATNGACKVKFKAKETGGTVRTGEVALS